MNEQEFTHWCLENKILETAKQLIQSIRNSPPSRVVGGGRYNVPGRYPSKKMKLTIQFESHKNELPSILQKEHDTDVLEYYDQPSSIKLNYQSKDNKNLGVISTPDFFVIHKNCAYWEEWKTEEELLKLAEHSPNRYIKEEDGTWRCPPGEEYAEKFGLQYKLKSSEEIDWIFQRNIDFLEDYFFDDKTLVSDQARTHIISIVDENPGIFLSDLLSSENIAADDIYLLIAREEIYIDIYKKCVSEPETVHVYIDKQHANAYESILESNCTSKFNTYAITTEVGQEVLWDGVIWRIINLGDSNISLISDTSKYVDLPNDIFASFVNQGKIKGILNNDIKNSISSKKNEIIKAASKEDLEEATRRYNCLRRILDNEEVNQSEFKSRTVRHWMKKYKDAQEIYGNGYVGLIPKDKAKGNRSRKLPIDTLELAHEFITNDYETKKQKNVLVVYGAMQNECEKRGLIAPSYKTFCNLVKGRNKENQTRQREGNRAAYEHEKFFWELTPTTPRHGERPFEIGHIDHTELDLELVHSRTKKNLGRCWLTFFIDAFSRRILSLYITFDPPSYRSDMMVLRECVRRFGQLPSTIVVDGGKDFKSIYFDSFLAHYEVRKKIRPSAKARFGSVLERLFGTVNTQFIYHLQGNTQIMKNVRQVTKSVNPKQHAIWTLELLFERLCVWAYEVYDTNEHPALGQSPREAFQLGIASSGKRPIRWIAFDEVFKIMSLGSTDKGTAKVQVGHGVRINYINYWADQMKSPDVENKQVPVRYDPYDIGIAYAYIKGKWTKCISEYYSYLHGKTEKEVQLITEEIRKQKKNSSSKVTITAKKIAKFMEDNEKIEAILIQRLKDSEAKHIIKSMGNQICEPEDNTNCISENSVNSRNSDKLPTSSDCPEESNLYDYGEYL